MPRYLKRWFSNLFSSKKHERKDEFLDSGVMSEKKSGASRHHRKLPSLPARSQDHAYWPSFRGALEYMQKHREVVETAINLMEIYPRLVQHSSCDRLWDFITKVTFFHSMERKLPNIPKYAKESNQNGTKNVQRKSKPKTPSVTSSSDDRADSGDRDNCSERPDKTIPHISICHVADDTVIDKGCSQGISQKVYLCGHCQDDRWSRLVASVAEKYYIRCSVDGSDEEQRMREAGLIVFLLDEHSITPSSRYASHLKFALSHGINVLYVRCSSLEIPDTPASHSFSTLPHIDHKDYETSSRSTSFGLSPFDIGQDESRSVSTGNLHAQFSTPSSYLAERRNHPSRDSSLFHCITPAPTITSPKKDNSRMYLDIETRAHSAASSSSFASHDSSFSDSSLKPKTPLPQLGRFHGDHLQAKTGIDVGRILQQGLSCAVVYDRTRHADTAKHVLTAIDGRFCWRSVSGQVVAENSFLTTPASDEMFSSKDSAIGDMYISTNNSIHEGNHDDNRDDSLDVRHDDNHDDDFGDDKRDDNYDDSHDGSHDTLTDLSYHGDNDSDEDNDSSPETVFVVFDTDNNVNMHIPKIVHYPSDHPHVDLSTSSSIDSFGFQDIDLSRHVNELDLFARTQDFDFD